MDHKNTAQQQGPSATTQQAAGQPGVVPVQPARFPASPGVCIAGSTASGLYRIVQAEDMERRMTYLRSRAPFPLDIFAWLPGSFADSQRQRSRLVYLFSAKNNGGWYALSADDLAEARAYLNGEKERLEQEAERTRQEAARVKEQAAKSVDDCIRRLRIMAEFVRHFSGQERRLIKSTWPQQQKTDEFLQLVDRFHAIAWKFETLLSRRAMEIQLERMPRGDDAPGEV